jgi:hypothetical protein
MDMIVIIIVIVVFICRQLSAADAGRLFVETKELIPDEEDSGLRPPKLIQGRE